MCEVKCEDAEIRDILIKKRSQLESDFTPIISCGLVSINLAFDHE